MTRALFEGLEHLDMQRMIDAVVSIDEYEARIGDNDDVITVSFIVKGEAVGEDLVDWLERGYDWVEDAELSEGELTVGHHVVFVEIARRSAAARRIMQMLDDLETLTGRPAHDYEFKIQQRKYPASEQVIQQHIALSPHAYRQTHEAELNEWRTRAGLDTVPVYERDELMRELQHRAGL